MLQACFFLILLISLPAFSQISPEKLMAIKERPKWLKAEQSIRKALAKDIASPEPTYLLSLYFFNSNHISFNVDSAHAYQQRSAKRYALTSIRDRERLRKIPLDSLHLLKLQTRIDSAAFAEAKRINTIQSYQRFILQHATAFQRDAATELRDEVAFTEALKINTWISFQTFIQQYPSSQTRTIEQRWNIQEPSSGLTVEQQRRVLKYCNGLEEIIRATTILDRETSKVFSEISSSFLWLLGASVSIQIAIILLGKTKANGLEQTSHLDKAHE